MAAEVTREKRAAGARVSRLARAFREPLTLPASLRDAVRGLHRVSEAADSLDPALPDVDPRPLEVIRGPDVDREGNAGQRTDVDDIRSVAAPVPRHAGARQRALGSDAEQDASSAPEASPQRTDDGRPRPEAPGAPVENQVEELQGTQMVSSADNRPDVAPGEGRADDERRVNRVGLTNTPTVPMAEIDAVRRLVRRGGDAIAGDDAQGLETEVGSDGHVDAVNNAQLEVAASRSETHRADPPRVKGKLSPEREKAAHNVHGSVGVQKDERGSFGSMARRIGDLADAILESSRSAAAADRNGGDRPQTHSAERPMAPYRTRDESHGRGRTGLPAPPDAYDQVRTTYGRHGVEEDAKGRGGARSGDVAARPEARSADAAPVPSAPAGKTRSAPRRPPSDLSLPEDDEERVAELVDRALRRQARRHGVDLS